MDIRLVAIVGKAHSGKTTLANALVGRGFQRFAFADPVKLVSAAMLNTFLFEVGADPQHYDIDKINSIKGHPSIRKLLQVVGTELGREWLGPQSLWIDLFEGSIEDAKHTAESADTPLWIVCDDCRFENEAARLSEMGFMLFKLERNEEERVASIRAATRDTNPDWDDARLNKTVEEILSHPSETEVDKIKPDFVIQSLTVDQLVGDIAPLFTDPDHIKSAFSIVGSPHLSIPF